MAPGHTKERRHKVEKIAPGWGDAACRLWFEGGLDKQQIFEAFQEQFGEGVVSRSAFYVWMKEQLTAERQQKALVKQSKSLAQVAIGNDVDPDDLAHKSLLFQLAGWVQRTGEDMQVDEMMKLLLTIDRIRRTELDVDKYRAAVKEKADQAAKELERKLAEQNVDKETTADLVRQVYGIAA